MEEIQLFATDMDGTLLRSDLTFDLTRLTGIIERLTAAGKSFAAASGRSLPTLEKIFEPVKDKMAFVAENGCVVKFDGDVIFTQKIPDETLDALVKQLDAMDNHDFLISGLDGGYVLPGASDDYFEHACRYYEKVQKVDDWRLVKDKLLKITTNFESDEVERASRQIEQAIPGLRCTTTGFTSIDILPDGLSKATGLSELAKKMGLTSSNICAYGDQMNDFEMLTYAGTSVVVSNAVAELKEIADYEIASNDENAVLTDIERILEEIK